MAVTANSIVSPQTPNSNNVTTSGANTNYTSPTNTSALITAGANGARVTKVGAIAAANQTSANQVQLFRSTDGGTTKRFFASAAMASGSLTQTTAAQTVDFGYSDTNPLILKAGEIVYIATGQNQAVSGFAEWGDY